MDGNTNTRTSLEPEKSCDSVRQECTELFLRYREVARMIWNIGFWPDMRLREWDAVEAYREAVARLFESMVLLPLGYHAHIEYPDSPGRIACFHVTIKGHPMQILVDKNLPDEPGHQWENRSLQLSAASKAFEMQFVRFFDWDQLGRRDFEFLEVLITRLDDRPEMVGHHALAKPSDCEIWLVEDLPA